MQLLLALARSGVLAFAAWGLLAPIAAHAQPTGDRSVQPQVLALDAFQKRVLASHPELAQVRNEQAQARRLITAAQGAFDPRLAASLAQKRFKDEPYYAVSDVGISVPTFVGADFKLGYERGVGTRVNPENFTPSGGLLTLGVSIPLARDIITDERRTGLARARAISAIADADVVAQSNKLLLNATKAYADWYLAYRKYVIADSSLGLATFRLASVQARIAAGENPPIDSVEARLEVRKRQVLILEAQNDQLVAQLEAAAYLWGPSQLATQISITDVPVLPAIPINVGDTAAVAAWIADAARSHPAVRKANGKIALESAEWRLNAQGLLPDVDITLSSIASGTAGPLVRPSQWESNYKAMATGETSLLLRKERGKMQASALKVESARLERDLVQRRVTIEIRAALNALMMVESAVQLQRDNVAAAGLLRDAEEVRFANGESTLLSVNLRERLLLDELVKLEQFNAKRISAGMLLTTARGIAVF